jgi:hypothetical protein
MAQFLGKNMVVTFASTTLNTLFRSASVEESVDLVDKSAFADAHKSYIAALKDTKFSIEFLVDGTTAWGACAPGTEGTLVYSPEGTSAGKPKYTAVGIVASRSKDNPYNDLVTASVDFQLQAAWTEGTN